ncbi:hypothetical protein BGX28_002689 [Mortierella sp. GBA30]|nr:hypothetical protein BGX28_002689 [Mortierella sp. GBA30]
MQPRQSLFFIQQTSGVRSAASAQSRSASRVLSFSRRSALWCRYSLYSTSSNVKTNSTSTGSNGTYYSTSPNGTSATPKPNPNTGSEGAGDWLAGWVRRISLMSASAAMGALAYAKLDPANVGGFSGMPVGKIQPSIITNEEPDEPFQTSLRPSPEKVEEIKRSVLLQNRMEELELVHEYKSKVKAGEWKEADPYWYLTKNTEPHHLTAGTLRGENMLSVHPLKFERKDKKAIVLFMHLGRSLCGHDRIIHGGLLATLLDEATGMVALPNLPFHIGFTANLNVNYRKPVKADQFVMVKAEFEKGEGRKGYTVASIHDLNGNTLVECSALYVSPKNPVVMVANYVKNSLGFSGSS